MSTIATVAVGVLLAAVLVRWMEPRMIFLPARYPAGLWDPEAIGVRARDVEFVASDGVRLHGWWVVGSAESSRRPDGAGPRPVLLWCHGNAGNVTGRGPHAQILADQGLDVLVFDYRGYGRSEGRPSEEGIYLDTVAAYEHLVRDLAVDPRRIVLLGRSLGSVPAARLSTEVAHAGLVLVSPFTSARDMARLAFGGLPVDLLARSKLDVEGPVAARTTPLLVIHGSSDEVVPFDLGVRVHAAAAPPKEFLELPGAGHNDILVAGGRLYVDALAGFAHRVVAAAHDALE